jgi:hypothetical protein
MAVGAVENRRRFSKDRWARPRVHGAGSVHGLFLGACPAGFGAGRSPRLSMPIRAAADERAVAAGSKDRSTRRASAGAIVDPGAS